MESAEVAGRGEDERRLDALGVLAAERILRQAAEAADDLGCVIGCEVTPDPVDQPLGWPCHGSIVSKPGRRSVPWQQSDYVRF